MKTVKTSDRLSQVLDFILENADFGVSVQQTGGRPFNSARNALQDAVDEFGFTKLLDAVDAQSDYVHSLLEDWEADELTLEQKAKALVSALAADYAESACEADFGGNVGDGAAYVATF
jgi:hypothetical protein